MKTRILIVFAVVALVVAVAYTASTSAGLNEGNAHGVPAAVPQPSTATAAAAEPHPEIREAIAALRAPRNTWSTRRTISARTAWKPSRRAMWPFTSLSIASSTTETKTRAH
jgi:hypothetical protein